MLVHFPNSTVEVGESRGLTGLDRNTFQSKAFCLLVAAKNTKSVLFAEFWDSHESEREK